MSSVQSADGAKWIIAAMPCKCPNCLTSNMLWFPSPKSENRGHITLFGDESFDWRKGTESLLYIYTLVGLNGPVISKIGPIIEQTKLELRPKSDPKSWPLHIIDIRDERWRRRHGVGQPIHEINSMIRRMAEALQSPKEERVISIFITPIDGERTGKRKAESAARDIVLQSALFATTEMLTNQGFSIDFVLEAQTDAHSRNAIDDSVEKVARSLRHNLSFLYCCKGMHVGLPITVPKGQRLELEVADLVAYIARRYFHCWKIKRQTEFPLELLGKVFWGAFTETRFGTIEAVGFPWKHFFP